MKNYEEFAEHIKNNIKEYLPKEYADANVVLNPVSKVNSIELTSLNIIQSGCNISPNIYLEKFYDEYLRAEKSLEDCMKDISKLQRKLEQMEKPDIINDIANFFAVEEKIIPVVVGAEQNKNLLTQVPHRIENDMAVYYKVLVEALEGERSTFTITNDIAQVYKVNEESLHKIAFDNALKQEPAQLHSMTEVMLGLMHNSEKKGEGNYLIDDEVMDEALYVLTNPSKINGAVTLFYPGIREQIAEKVGGDYYVLPSSIHETLILPKELAMDADELKEMVMDINRTQVSPQERLTDNVYLYNSKTKELLEATSKQLFKKSQLETMNLSNGNDEFGFNFQI